MGEHAHHRPLREAGQALVVVDSDLRSIVPEWIELLAGPILKGGYDFVAPLYARYKYDGTITNTVTYPLTRALYGNRIRQPIGGDFGGKGDFMDVPVCYLLSFKSGRPVKITLTREEPL